MTNVNWISLLEAKLVRGVKNLTDTKGTVVLDAGRGGWFQCYIAMEFPETDKKLGIVTQSELATIFDDPASPNFSKSRVMMAAGKKLVEKAKQASDQLAKAGFKRMRATIVAKDHKGIMNPITGGGVGGQAIIQHHVITIDLPPVLSDSKTTLVTIAHEWAHFLWFNVLDKEQRDTFAKWWEANILSHVKKQAFAKTKRSKKGRESYLDSASDAALTMRKSFLRVIEAEMGKEMSDTFFAARDSYIVQANRSEVTDEKALAWILTKKWIAHNTIVNEDDCWVPGILKEDVVFRSSAHRLIDKPVPKGTPVELNYINHEVITKKGDGKLEFPTGFAKALQIVDIITPASDDDRDEIEKWSKLLLERDPKKIFPRQVLIKAAEESIKKLAYEIRWDHIDDRLQQRVHDLGAEKFVDAVYKILKKYMGPKGSQSYYWHNTMEDVVKELVSIDDYLDMENDRSGKIQKTLSEPSGVGLRAIASTGIRTSNSSYGASKPEELWSVAIETMVVLPTAIGPELAKLVTRLASGEHVR